MDQDTSSLQECGPNLMAARDIMILDEEERAARVHDRRYSKEFDLCENYQNAVDCLIQCEYIIKTQQQQLASQDDQLASKDEHIASLEEKLSQVQMSASNADDEQIASLEDKLIQMSFELASSKALQDEQLHRFNKRISSVENSNSSVEEKGECAAPPSQQQQQQQEQTATKKVHDYAHYKPRPRNSPTRPKPLIRSLSTTCSSFSATDLTMDSYEVDTIGWPSHEMSDEKHDPKPRRRCGFHLSRLAQRMSWNIDDSTASITLDDSTKESITSNTIGGLISSFTAGSDYSAKEVRDNSTTGIIGSRSFYGTNVRTALDNGPALAAPTSNGARRQSQSSTALDNGRTVPTRRITRQEPFTALNNEPPRPTRRLTRQEPFSTKKLSNFGSFILGLNKNDNTKAAADEEKTNDEDDPPSRRGSSRSVISGVVFPVTSGDCLIGLYKDAASLYKDAAMGISLESGLSITRGRCPNINKPSANAQWPEF